MPAVLTDVLQTRLDLVGLGAYTSGFGTATAALGLHAQKLSDLEKRSLAFGAASSALALGLAAGLKRTVQEAGNLEQIEVGFKTVFGGADAAKQRLREVQEFAAKTPFNFIQTAALEKQLSAMGVKADDLVPTMRDLGDAVAALGLGGDALQRIVLNYGQIKTQGKLTARELRDFAINGIPVFDILKEELHLTGEQLRNIGNEGITADRGLAALRAGLQKRFGGAMEAQNRTLQGSFSNLQDSAQRAAATIGRPLLFPVTATERGVTHLIDLFNNAGPVVQGLTTTIAVGATAALTIYSARTLWAVYQTARLASENVKLQNASLNAGKGAAGQAGQEAALGETIIGTDRAVVGLIERLGLLEGAHIRAGEAAGFQAGEEGRLGGAVGAAGGRGGTRTTTTRGAAAAEEEAAGGARPRSRRKAQPTAGNPAFAPEEPPAPEAPPTAGPQVNPGATAAGAAGVAGLWARLFGTKAAQAGAAASAAARGGTAAGAGAASKAAPVGGAEWIISGQRNFVFPGTRGAVNAAAGMAKGAAPTAGAVGAGAAGATVAAEAGMVARLGGLLGKLKIGSPAAMAAMIVGDLALNFVPEDHGAVSMLKHTGQGALTGAGWGAMVGMLGGPFAGISVPTGMAGGALIGGGAALIGDLMGQHGASAQPKPATPPKSSQDQLLTEIRDEVKRHNELLETISGKQGSGKLPFDVSALAGALQLEAITGVRDML